MYASMSRALNASIHRRTSSTLRSDIHAHLGQVQVLRHRLLLQPHGFEGFVAILVLIEVDDLPIAHLEVSVQVNVNLDATCLAATEYGRRDENAFASCIEYLVDLKAVLVPCIEPSVPDAHGTIETIRGRVVVLKGHPFDARMEEFTERVGVVDERPHPP